MIALRASPRWSRCSSRSRGKDHAVVPLDLFAEPVFARGNLALFIINIAFMGLVMFLPLYLQVARGVSATDSGFALLPLMGGILVASMIVGAGDEPDQGYKPVLVAGAVVTLSRVALMLQIGPDTSRDGLLWRLRAARLRPRPGAGHVHAGDPERGRRRARSASRRRARSSSARSARPSASRCSARC